MQCEDNIMTGGCLFHPPYNGLDFLEKILMLEQNENVSHMNVLMNVILFKQLFSLIYICSLS